MKFKISEEALQYIKENGQCATIVNGTVSGCCIVAEPMPQIQLGPPKHLALYNQNTVEDITLYIDKQLHTDKQITIFMGKLLMLKKLAVELM